jgi:putative SOS response-associated peptidase YedK
VTVCNLYNVTTNQQAILDFTRALLAQIGNLPPSLDIYPDYAAPIVRNGKGGARELSNARWGMPTPPQYLKGVTDSGVTNIRNPKSPHWRGWLRVEHRCVVPATSFSEWAGEKGSQRKVWFALDDNQPLFFFAGIWTRWTGVRKKKEGEAAHDLFGFLTCEPNELVRPIHPKAMPVLLTREDEVETWLTAPIEEAIKLQRPLPDGDLMIVDRES